MTHRRSTIKTGVFEERVDVDGRRQLSLTRMERYALKRQQLAERAAMLFLDLETRRSWPQMAEELGISVHALKDLVKTREFDEAYNLLFPEIGHDPRFRAARGALSDLVPTAVLKLQEMLDDPATPKSTLLKVIERILELNQVDNRGMQSDRLELMEFLKGMGGVTIENVNIIPPEYVKELQRISGPKDEVVIDAVVTDVEG